MKANYLIYSIFLIVVVLIIWIGMDTFSQPGISDLKGNYSEVSKFRNENNTGPVIRVYAVYAADSLWEDMEAYGNYMPHTKYGVTRVFFFSNLSHTPREVGPDPPYFDKEYQMYCMAEYVKSPMGGVSMKKYPFR